MRGLLKPLCLGAFLSLLVAAPPAVAVEGIIMDWAPECYGWETNYDPVTHTSAAGSQLTIVGKIDHFFEPFLDLDPVATEYTFIFKDLISDGSYSGGGVVITTYSGGTFEIYEDPTNNFDFGIDPPNETSPSTFVDGTLILEGTLSGFYVQTSVGPGGYHFGTYLADFEFTGPVGTEIHHRVEGCYGTTGGGWTDDAASGIPTGYNFDVDGHLSVEDCRPTGTDESSWGTIKSLFQ